MTKSISRISGTVATLLIALVCIPRGVEAHLVTTGMGPVYDGVGHLLLTPEDLMPVLALALYAGQRGAATGRRVMFLLPLAWCIGGIAGTALNVTTALPLPAVSLFVLGGLVAADFCLPTAAVAGVTITLGLAHGFLNGAVLKEGAGMLGLVGIITVLFVLVTVASAGVVSLEKAWTRIAVRIVGSWIAAVGMLMFGWSLR